MADLSPKELEVAKLVFDILDADGTGKLDALNLGDALRCCGLNPTCAVVEKHGGTKKKGEKSFTIEEYLPLYAQLKNMKDVGTIEDFLEGLKVYDKAENGTMMLAELSHVLLSLGERLTDPEVEEALKFVGTEDDEGFINYTTWLKVLMAGGPEGAGPPS